MLLVVRLLRRLFSLLRYPNTRCGCWFYGTKSKRVVLPEDTIRVHEGMLAPFHRKDNKEPSTLGVFLIIAIDILSLLRTFTHPLQPLCDDTAV